MDPEKLRPVFQEVDGHVIPNLTAEPDGKEFFTSDQIAARQGRAVAYWDQFWHKAFGRAAAHRQDTAEPLRKQPTPAAAAGPAEASVSAAVESLERAMLRKFVFPHLSDEDFELYLTYCRKYRLDPFSRAIIPMRRYDAEKDRDVFEVFLTIDALIAIAEETGLYEGFGTTQWCGEDGAWVDVWTKPQPPVAARCPVFKKGYREPTMVPAYLAFYQPFTKDAEGETRTPDYWQRDDGKHMIAKCSLSLSLHRAFASAYGPLKSFDEYSGLISRGTRQLRERPDQGGDLPPDAPPASDAPDSQVVDDAEPSFDAATGAPAEQKSPAAARRRPDVREVIRAANAAGDKERQIGPPAPASMRRRDWGPYPCTYNAFNLALLDLGFDTDAKRKAIRELFRTQWPRQLENNAEQFYKGVLDAIRRDPAEYGATLPPEEEPGKAA